MPLSEPSWWYDRERTLEARCLAPIAGLYGWITTRRIANAKPYRASVPVICVGNLTAGGSGKTPLALSLADEVAALGRTAVFLTRGYGGHQAGPHWVDRSIDTAERVGDETLLLAARAPTIVSRRRDAGARLAERSGPADAVIIMDDGLQNPHLVKDLSFAVINGARGLGNARVIPAGPLRAPASIQTNWIDAFVINDTTRLVGGTERAAEDLAKIAGQRPVLRASPQPIGDYAWLTGTKVFAFAGIAHPERFFRMLIQLGADVIGTRVFNDHEVLGDAAASDLIAAADAADARLVTTAKDIARLAKAPGDSATAQLAQTVRSVSVSLLFEDHDRRRLRALIRTAIEDRSPSRAVPHDEADLSSASARNS